jgi:outer membrane protein assembly factor BamD (BamD/ComL family)
MMSFKRFSHLAVLLSVLAASGCQSWLGGEQHVRSQSPGGLGSMPRPPQTPKSGEDEPTLAESVSERISKLWKPNPDAAKAREAFQEAEQNFAKKEYGSAVGLYQQAADLAPDSVMEEDSMFMVGECYFFDDKYSNAAGAYHRLLAKYNNSRHLDRVVARLYLVGEYWRDSNQRSRHYPLVPNFMDKTRPWYDTGGHALKSFEQVWLNDPTGPLADDSVMQTANTHFLSEDWDNADQYYTQLRKDFPQSKHVVKAFFLGFRAKLNAYQGPGYDPSPLLQAEELIETLLLQFNSQLSPEERKLVQQAKQEVYAQKAERDWALAEFYTRNGHHRGARHYYQLVMKNYPNSEFARLSAERLKENANEPAEPPARLTWLSRLFPEQREIPKPIDPRDAEN